jgi:hypothetical protein
MAATQLPKSGLIKQAFKDKQWDAALDAGFDAWEGRIGVAGNGSPVGVAQGFYIGQTYYDTAAKILYYCTTPGSASTTVWSRTATDASISNYGNYVSLPNGGIISPVHHRMVLGYEATTPGSWTMQSGGFPGGWSARIACWNAAGGNVTIVGALGAPIVSMGQRLTSLALTFGDEGELYTPNGTTFIWSRGRHFTSPPFQLNAGSTFDFSHNLGVQPQRMILRLTCTVPDLGYDPGDTLYLNTDNQAANYGCMLKASQTIASVKFAVAGMQFITWDTGITAPATMQNWNGVIRADVMN